MIRPWLILSLSLLAIVFIAVIVWDHYQCHILQQGGGFTYYGAGC
jgi:hypothetical protein